MKNLYIVLIRAHTGLGSIARLVTKYDYTHIAVCTSRKLDDFITYSRRRHYLPFDAGFMHEKRDFYAFGRHKNVKVKIFMLPVDDSHYRAVMDFIRDCRNDDEQLFNLFSMMTMPVLHGFRIYKAHNCMSFVSRIIELSGKVKLEKSIYKYDIREIDNLLSDYFIREGYLKRHDSDEYYDYMSYPPVTDYFRYGAGLVSKLVYRMIFCRDKE